MQPRSLPALRNIPGLRPALWQRGEAGIGGRWKESSIWG